MCTIKEPFTLYWSLAWTTIYRLQYFAWGKVVYQLQALVLDTKFWVWPHSVSVPLVLFFTSACVVVSCEVLVSKITKVNSAIGPFRRTWKWSYLGEKKQKQFSLYNICKIAAEQINNLVGTQNKNPSMRRWRGFPLALSGIYLSPVHLTREMYL